MVAPVPSRVRNWLTPAAWIAAVTAALLLLFPYGFPNYDTIYALLWGTGDGAWHEPGHGRRAAAHPTSPGGAVRPGRDPARRRRDRPDDGRSPTPRSGLVGYLVYRLGSLWFDRPIGAVAALLVLTRAPYLSNGLRAYIDLPYIVLVLGALVIETRRQEAHKEMGWVRSGWSWPCWPSPACSAPKLGSSQSHTSRIWRPDDSRAVMERVP